MSNYIINEILDIVGINFENLDDSSSQIIILRESLLNDEKYNQVKNKIPELKKFFSSSFLTSLQNNAEKKQKWPLINLIRQILKVQNYKMEPYRKSNGYSIDGKKKYLRYFLIKK